MVAALREATYLQRMICHEVPPVRCLCLLLALVLPAVGNDEAVKRSGYRFEHIPLEVVPAYDPARGPDGRFVSISRPAIVQELRELSGVALKERGANLMPPDMPRVICRYDSYSAVDDVWFKQFLAWFKKELKVLGLSYRSETWDCDDFSWSLNAMADLALLRTKAHPAPHLIGRLVVSQEEEWAGVSAGGLHELVIYRSGSGWHVVEPQNGKTVALAKYPNRRGIREVLFN